jgi:murein DD-endopeptidase MepM/ murein hydrolase activator NlpD
MFAPEKKFGHGPIVMRYRPHKVVVDAVSNRPVRAISNGYQVRFREVRRNMS